MRVTTFDPDGKVIEEREVPDDDPPHPLDREAQLAALLAAKGVITTKEAADVSGRPEQALVAEVEAWAVASLAAEDTRKR